MTTATQLKPFIDQSKVQLKGLKARAFMPHVVHMNQLIIVPTVEVNVDMFLVNGLTPTTVKVSTPCDIFNWQVIDSNKNVVESEPGVICPQMIAEKNLFPLQIIHQRSTIELNVDLYEDGKEYLLQCTFWGQPAQVKFKVAKTYIEITELFN